MATSESSPLKVEQEATTETDYSDLDKISTEMEQELDATENSDSDLDEISTQGVEVNIAIVGKAGSGRSSFVNAINGERVGMASTGNQPVSYSRSANPNINFSILPNINQETHPAFKRFLESVEIEKFDAFLFFTAREFNQWHSIFAKKVESSNKPFFLIRAKIDGDICPEEEIDEGKMIEEIKADLADNLKVHFCDGYKVYLISNKHPDKWEFYKLAKAIADSLPSPQKKCFNRIPKDLKELIVWQEFQSFLKETDEKEKTAKIARIFPSVRDMKQLFSKCGIAGMQRMMNEKLEGWKNVKINLAILGNSGVGKSSFINAIRGVDDGDKEQAAETGVTEKTKTPASYGHPTNLNIRFWDLPGIGTPDYPNLPTFCQKVHIEKYDTFLIITAKRFTEYDLQLAKKVESMGKSFFFVRTKIDNDRRSELRKKGFNEEKMLKKIRDDCVENLRNFSFGEEKIFLVSNHNPAKWDFHRLEEAILEQLPAKQKEALTLTMRTDSKVILREKIKLLKGMYDDIQGNQVKYQ
ncbi:interferon-inducible GTPase 5-like [Paramuricea clavata]|uniref:Interferon-inducible GTPase 5-like n=1 Tax=Paramuricea clavata TaxID=317549 RepID=A0A6S7H469_PARCT|nr:interferon-inducible GTPase 5-like [Paramuricea clavata]